MHLWLIITGNYPPSCSYKNVLSQRIYEWAEQKCPANGFYPGHSAADVIFVLIQRACSTRSQLYGVLWTKVICLC